MLALGGAVNCVLPGKFRCLFLATALVLGGLLSTAASANAVGPVDVKKYGAKGDGVTDDTDAIQKAMDSAASGNGDHTVYFPTARYLISGALRASNVKIRGFFSALILANADAKLEIAGTQTEVFEMSFENLTPGGVAIVCNKAEEFMIARCHFDKGFQSDIVVSESRLGVIRQNSFSVSNSGQGISASDVGYLSVVNNVMLGDPFTSVGVLIEHGQQCLVSGNLFEPLKFGAVLTYNVFGKIEFNNFQSPLVGSAIANSNGCKCQSNQYSDSIFYGCVARGNTNTDIRYNRFKGGQVGIFEEGDEESLMYSNDIADTRAGIISEFSSLSEFSHNVINKASVFGLDIRHDRGILVSRCEIRDVGGAGLFIADTSNSGVVDTVIQRCDQQGIYELDCTGYCAIQTNRIDNCGLAATDPAAVIFVNSPKATDIVIASNEYTGNAKNLKYFIRSIQQPKRISGNRTDTLLPTKIGPDMP